MKKSDDKGRREKPRGMPAVQESREKRRDLLRIPPRVFLWGFTILAGWAIIYWKIDQGEVESWRNRLLADQRAVSSELAPRYTPLRDQFETWILEAAKPYPGDFVDPAALDSNFRSKPGVYLRLYIDDAKDVDSLRSAAMDSLRDGFTSCFTLYDNPDPFDGPPCMRHHDCPSGQHCNETNHCTEPAQPYNLRVAYRAARVLYDDWTKEVREASNDMRLRLLERDFESAVKDDMPLAIDLMVRAKYLLLVLDEQAEKPDEVPDAGTYSESLQAVKHPVRVFVWDIPNKKLLLRTRTSATASVGTLPPDPLARLAVRRQSNNCAVAVEVRRLLGDESVIGEVQDPASLPDAGAAPVPAASSAP